jgi:hypothetical protein
MLERPERLYLYKHKLFLTYYIKYSKYYNEYFKADWHSFEERYIAVGFNFEWHWFNFQFMEYESLEVYCITILGMVFVKGIGFQAEPVE